MSRTPKPPIALLAAALLAGAGACRERPPEAGAAAVELPAAAPAAAAAPELEAPAGPEVDVREPPAAPPDQVEEYEARRPKTVLQLQPFRATTSIQIEDDAGNSGVATLIDLNPWIHDWLLLQLQWLEGDGGEWYHLENPDPSSQQVVLDPRFVHGLLLRRGGRPWPCDLWGGGALAAARAGSEVEAPLCAGRLYLRNRVEGRKTTLEWATDFLRDFVWRGEQITVFVREQFYKDAFLATSEVLEGDGPDAGTRPRPEGAPDRPLVDPRWDGRYLVPVDLGINLENDVPNQVLVGRWYRARRLPGIYVSAIQPGLVSEEVIRAQKGLVNPLDEVESSALTYMVAFDLERFDVEFALGTEHPRVNWSDRVPALVRDASLPGPDGIGTISPLVATGIVSPFHEKRVAATFTAGFKRTHGAFRFSELALKNSGSHYGFIEHGAVLSKLQPDLATAIVRDDGRVELKTWREEDDADLVRIRHARQNGLPIIDHDPETGVSTVGALVPKWSLGNWSGSQDKRLRTLRAGLCLQEGREGRFLIYGYFSSVTPSAMARVFAAYHCRYAMLLDMNALEHTYLAVYRTENSSFVTQHLIEEMSVLDKSVGEQLLPRFVGFSDNRDFFYLVRKEAS